MTIEQYGIKLKRITVDDIELIRNWRNHPDIRKKMLYQKTISQKAQKKWFESVNNKFNYYFLIQFENEFIGVINAKNLDRKEGYGEGGIFIWSKKHLNSPAPVLASLCLLNFVFHLTKICNKSFIQILHTNEEAKKYNRLLGYRLIPRQEKVINQWYLLTKEDYEKHASKMIKGAQILTGDSLPPRVFGIPSELNVEEINQIIQSPEK